MKIHNRTKAVLIATLTLVITSIALYGVLFAKIDSLMADVRVSHETLVAKQTQQRREQSVSQFVANTLGSRQELESHLFSTLNPTAFLGLLEELASGLNIDAEVQSIVEVTPEELLEATGESTDFGVVDVILKVEGSWSNVYQLAYQFERLPYLATLDQITLNYEPTSLSWRGWLKVRVQKHE